MGQQFEDVFGYKHITTSEIARGGQGAVFRTQNPNIAIKIELNSSGTEFSKDIEQNKKLDEIRLLPIPKKTNLTLPQATLKDYAGYAMTLLDDMASFEKVFDYSFDMKSEYTNSWLDELKDSAPEFVDVIAQYLQSGGRRRRLDAYLQVACILSTLHANGLVYCDFSSKNAFVSTVEGNNTVWLIDADNLDYQEKTRYSGYYTPGYGAPEVIKGKGCTFYSDSYAYAVSLFWQLSGTHPFKGALVEAGFDDDFMDDAEEKANSGEFPWIMDTEDRSNYIDAKIQQDLIISNRLAKYFDRTFCAEGKEKRQTRPTMFEWSYALVKELDLSVKCKHCGMDYDESNIVCPWCDAKTKRIMIVSKDNRKEVWKYVHELISGDYISVPIRIIMGFKSEECKNIAFNLIDQDNKMTISDLDEGLEWSVSTDGGLTYIDIYGKAAIPESCVIKCNNKTTNKQIVIEVSSI